jgi:hypothetical protein
MNTKNINRREVLIGAAGAVAVATLPAVALPEPELGVFEWLEQAEVDAIRSTWSRPSAGHFVVRDMLTPEEIAGLRRSATQTRAYAQRLFPNLKTPSRYGAREKDGPID